MNFCLSLVARRSAQFDAGAFQALLSCSPRFFSDGFTELDDRLGKNALSFAAKVIVSFERVEINVAEVDSDVSSAHCCLHTLGECLAT